MKGMSINEKDNIVRIMYKETVPTVFLIGGHLDPFLSLLLL